MKKYEYKNATVYITEPTEEHINNIKQATEKFLKRIIKERIKNDSSRKNNWRIGFYDLNARRRD